MATAEFNNTKGLWERLQATRNTKSVWQLLVEFADRFDLQRVRYFPLYKALQEEFPKSLIRHSGYSEYWIQQYFQNARYDVDPMPRHALRTHKPYLRTGLMEQRYISDVQLKYLQDVQSELTGDDIGCPVFGPAGQNACIEFGFLDPTRKISEYEQSKMQWIAQSTHVRLIELDRDNSDRVPQLSPREKEILRLVALGNTNTAISTLANISNNTVDTHLRRIFAKLQVTDRTAAAITAYSDGLL